MDVVILNVVLHPSISTHVINVKIIPKNTMNVDMFPILWDEEIFTLIIQQDMFLIDQIVIILKISILMP